MKRQKMSPICYFFMMNGQISHSGFLQPFFQNLTAFGFDVIQNVKQLRQPAKRAFSTEC